MPNLNKLRGGKVGQGAAPASQYGLSQAKYHNSESRLQNPHSRLGGKTVIALTQLVLTIVLQLQSIGRCQADDH